MATKRSAQHRIWYGLDENLALFRYTHGSKLGALLLRIGKMQQLLEICIGHGAITGAAVDIAHPIVLGEITNFDSLLLDLVDREAAGMYAKDPTKRGEAPALQFQHQLRATGVGMLTGAMVDQLKVAGEVKWLYRSYRVNPSGEGVACQVDFSAGGAGQHPCHTTVFNAKVLLAQTYQYSRSASHEEKARGRLP
jgi:hypothetical protein